MTHVVNGAMVAMATWVYLRPYISGERRHDGIDIVNNDLSELVAQYINRQRQIYNLMLAIMRDPVPRMFLTIGPNDYQHLPRMRITCILTFQIHLPRVPLRLCNIFGLSRTRTGMSWSGCSTTGCTKRLIWRLWNKSGMGCSSYTGSNGSVTL